MSNVSLPTPSWYTDFIYILSATFSCDSNGPDFDNDGQYYVAPVYRYQINSVGNYKFIVLETISCVMNFSSRNITFCWGSQNRVRCNLALELQSHRPNRLVGLEK